LGTTVEKRRNIRRGVVINAAAVQEYRMAVYGDQQEAVGIRFWLSAMRAWTRIPPPKRHIVTMSVVVGLLRF
jgi:hypothetical protein